VKNDEDKGAATCYRLPDLVANRGWP